MKELVYKKALKCACDELGIAVTKDHKQLFLRGMVFGIQETRKIVLTIGGRI